MNSPEWMQIANTKRKQTRERKKNCKIYEDDVKNYVAKRRILEIAQIVFYLTKKNLIELSNYNKKKKTRGKGRDIKEGEFNLFFMTQTHRTQHRKKRLTLEFI